MFVEDDEFELDCCVEWSLVLQTRRVESAAVKSMIGNSL